MRSFDGGCCGECRLSCEGRRCINRLLETLTFHGQLMLVWVFCLVKLFPCLCKLVGVMTSLSEHVCDSRSPEFCSPFAAGTTCIECGSDGGFDGRHRSLHAQHQLQYWHGMPGGSVWALHNHGECPISLELLEFDVTIDIVQKMEQILVRKLLR